MSQIKLLETLNINIRQHRKMWVCMALRQADDEIVCTLITNNSETVMLKRKVGGEHLKWNMKKIENPRIMGLQIDSLLWLERKSPKCYIWSFSAGSGWTYPILKYSLLFGLYNEKGEYNVQNFS